jgi:hypothetical protein
MPGSKRTRAGGFLAPASSGAWDGFSVLVRPSQGTQSCTLPTSSTCSATSLPSASSPSVLPTCQEIVPAACSSLVTTLVTRAVGTVRQDLPVSSYSRRAEPKRALVSLAVPGGREQLLAELQKDFTAASSATGKTSLLTTWKNFHEEWFGDTLPLFPLTVE